MHLSDFSYNLPADRIAQHPLAQRDTSRLMILNRNAGIIQHKTFSSLAEYLQAGDLLILNDTKVIPCRLFGKKKTGGKLEIFFLLAIQENLWEVLIRGKIKIDEPFYLAEGSLIGKIIKKKQGGRCIVTFSGKKSVNQILQNHGQAPLPPYIKHFQSPTQEDKIRYQTIFAENNGAVAAPTAGLHFTKSLLRRIQNKGISVDFVTLHVGLGTFKPVKVETIEDHTIEPEFYSLKRETLQKVRETKKQGGRVIACGTTSTRVLESLGQNPDLPLQGWTDLYIYPGFPFKMVDVLITNFHLPKSTLLMLVCAFAGRDFVLKAYHQAIEEKYRFYSYGDAMLIL